MTTGGSSACACSVQNLPTQLTYPPRTGGDGRTDAELQVRLEFEPQHFTRPNRHVFRKLLGIRRRSQIDKGELPTRSAVGVPWMVTDMDEMTTRSGHYTALVETMGARGATTLHADEREQLLAVADALLFGDPDSEQGLARALDLIAHLRESERWSAQSCAELREHLRGCGPLPAGT
jgi:hypothetical protein